MQSTLIKDTISCNRFIAINKFLSLGKKYPNDKLCKIRNLFEEINMLSARAYRPSNKLSIDESLIGYKGRCKLKQCLPMKSKKWDLKHSFSVKRLLGTASSIYVFLGKEDFFYAI